MKCWTCNEDLDWIEDQEFDDFYESEEEYTIVSNFSCPGCGAYVEFFHPTSKTPILEVIDGKKE